MSPGQPTVVVVTANENAIGMAGFIVSLVSLFVCCGVMSPIGLLLSLIGLCWAPRGMAISGVVLGMLGSSWIAALLAGVIVLPLSIPATLDTELHQPPRPSLADDPALTAPPERKQKPKLKPPVVPKKTIAKFRKWTSNDGTFETDGEFVSRTANMVRIRKSTGEVITVSIELLSDSDREWIRFYSRSVQ